MRLLSIIVFTCINICVLELCNGDDNIFSKLADDIKRIALNIYNGKLGNEDVRYKASASSNFLKKLGFDIENVLKNLYLDAPFAWLRDHPYTQKACAHLHAIWKALEPNDDSPELLEHYDDCVW